MGVAAGAFLAGAAGVARAWGRAGVWDLASASGAGRAPGILLLTSRCTMVRTSARISSVRLVSVGADELWLWWRRFELLPLNKDTSKLTIDKASASQGTQVSIGEEVVEVV